MPTPVPVRIAVPEAARAAVAYALAELLRGLGLEAVDAGAERARIVVGGDQARAGADALHLAAAPERLAALLASRGPLAADAGGWVEADGVGVPAPLAAASGEADVAGSAFLWLARYAEHARGAPRDAHGRATFAASWQAAHGLAAVPVVDVLREALAARLRDHPATSGLPIAHPTYGAASDGSGAAAWALCPTCDIDALRKWRAGIVRRDVLRAAHERRPGLAGAAAAGWIASHLARRDPMLVGIDRVAAAAERVGGTATFFVKAAAPTVYDTPYRLASSAFRRVRARIAAHEIGLHPSYASVSSVERLLVERARLERAVSSATGRPVTSVRQHYLRHDGPPTLRAHADAGFALDATLGWAEHEGFRCATTHPHRLFDLDANAATGVWELPLALMDATFAGYRALPPEAIAASTAILLAAAQRYRGVVVGLWHNTVGDEADAPGAAAHLDATLDAAAGQGARIGGVEAVLAAYRGA